MTTSEIVATWLVRLAGCYLALGVAFAAPFAWRGIARVDPHAQGASPGFRLLVTPGVAVLWPLLAWRWISGRTAPPEERNAHRSAARAFAAAPDRGGDR
jgi:hypothetical protein